MKNMFHSFWYTTLTSPSPRLWRRTSSSEFGRRQTCTKPEGQSSQTFTTSLASSCFRHFIEINWFSKFMKKRIVVAWILWLAYRGSVLSSTQCWPRCEATGSDLARQQALRVVRIWLNKEFTIMSLHVSALSVEQHEDACYGPLHSQAVRFKSWPGLYMTLGDFL